MKKKPRSALQLELEEVIAKFKEDGFSEEYIIATFKTVFENMRDPQPEIKGEIDT